MKDDISDVLIGITLVAVVLGLLLLPVALAAFIYSTIYGVH